MKNSSKYTIRNGYVYYNRLKDSPQAGWNKMYERGMEEFERIVGNFEPSPAVYAEMGHEVVALGRKEMQREVDLLNKLFDSNLSISQYNNPSYYKKLVTDIQLLMRVKEDMERVGGAAALKKAQQDPMEIPNYFSEFLEQAIRVDLANLVRRKGFIGLLYTDPDKAVSLIEEMLLNTSVPKAMDKMYSIEHKIGSPEDDWAKLFKSIQDIGIIQRDLNIAIFQSYDLKGVAKDIQKFMSEKKTSGQSLRGLKKKVDSNVLIGKKQLQAQVNQAISQQIGKTKTRGKATLKITSVKVQSNLPKIVSTDTNTDTTLTIDAAELIEIFQPKYLQDSAEYLQKFYKQTLSKLHDGFVVYESSQTLGLEKPNQERSGYLYSLPAEVARFDAGMAERTQTMIKALYNTIDGAIGQSKSLLIERHFIDAIVESVAAWLFQDWETSINSYNGNQNVIHVFKSGTVQIPMSILLIAIGESMIEAEQNPKRFLTMDIMLPRGGILYPEPITGPFKGGGENAIWAYWDEQRFRVEQESKYSLRVTNSFTSFIKSHL